MGKKLIDLDSYPVDTALSILLKDKTTKKNIIFATDIYDSYQVWAKSPVTETALRVISLQPRVEKKIEEKIHRTKTNAEVFTPSWIVNQMNNFCDEDWFGRKSVFNTENIDHSWSTRGEKILFSTDKSWQDYVLLKRLEIACGEAPFVVSRYDTTNGEKIPVKDRVGFLDRKLRVVSENTETEEEWLKWSTKALQSSYGYEYQGDNLVIARINVLDGLCEYRDQRFGGKTDQKQINYWANIIAWNFWQMDGLTGCIPFGKIKEPEQLELWEAIVVESDLSEPNEECKIRNWRSDKTLTYNSVKEGM
ncbi:restriction endonuclease subunit M [Lactobacillus delbrueckii subsp. bulgaricus]|nr:restriction endonuclease subunit M [Lactobacillus delbrueckii subsp. bulgaricus]MBT8908195.1 restriction endonuclease subunit M [Lactobacillus delbrueckii subsp. bulgaricus]